MQLRRAGATGSLLYWSNAVALAGLLFVVFLVPETSDRTLESLAADLSRCD